MQAIKFSDLSDDELERDDVVRGGQRISVLEVYLVLALAHFVVGGLDLKAHALERSDHGAPYLVALVDRRHVEIVARGPL